jgi:prolyl oligopeptidase
MIMSWKLIIVLITWICVSSCDQRVHEWRYPKFDPPPITDIYFGKNVVDEHRVLEKTDDPAVSAWNDAQRQFYSDVMKSVTGRDTLVNELKHYVASSSVRAYVPRLGGERLFIKRTDDVKNIQMLFYTDRHGKNEVELFNTSTLNNEGNIYSIDYFEPSYDGTYVVLGIAKNGSEISTMYTLDVNNKRILDDSISNCYLANPAWLPDGSGFFYNHLKDIKGPEDEQTMYERSRVKLHRVNKKNWEDIEVFSKTLNKDLNLQDIDFPFLYTFPKTGKLIAFVFRGSSPYVQVYFASLSDVTADATRAKWKRLGDESDKITSISMIKDRAFVLTFGNNAKGTLEAVQLNGHQEKRIVLDAKDIILKETFQNDKFIFVKYFKNGAYGLLQVDPVNYSATELKLPIQGSITLAPEYKLSTPGSSLFVGLEGWTRELGIYKYDGVTFSLTDIKPQTAFGHPEFLVVKEISVPSHDGTEVPVTLIYPKNIKLDGSNPTILYGYGAYGSSIEPGFDVTQLPWFNRGGVYAMAHVRGGGEKGDEWYLGGYKPTKSNSWKDFIACAEYLIKNQYTSPEHLAAFGGSAGAITIGRAITDRPQLFKAAVIQVGTLNAIRSEVSMNTLSVAEFGSVTDSLEFNYLMDMDVYHHIKKDVRYPSILFTCALNDARVAAWEPSKTVAKLQKYGTGKNIALIRISDEGHFGDSDFINETSDIYAFLLWQLGDQHFKYQQQ